MLNLSFRFAYRTLGASWAWIVPLGVVLSTFGATNGTVFTAILHPDEFLNILGYNYRNIRKRPVVLNVCKTHVGCRASFTFAEIPELCRCCSHESFYGIDFQLKYRPTHDNSR